MLKLPPCLLQWTGLVILFHVVCVCLYIIIDELAPEYSRILSELNLALPIMTLISPHSTGV